MYEPILSILSHKTKNLKAKNKMIDEIWKIDHLDIFALRWNR